MAQRLTVNEKLAYIDEVKLNVINAFGGNSEDLDYYLQEVVKKLKHVTKLSEMNSKKNIESTWARGYSWPLLALGNFPYPLSKEVVRIRRLTDASFFFFCRSSGVFTVHGVLI